MKSMKKCIVTKEKISKRIKRCSSAGMFYTSSAGAVTSLICFGNQKMLSRTRVAPARRHGRSALIRRYATSSTSGRNLRNVLYSIFLITLPVLLVHQAHATASTINISVVDNVSLSILPTSTSGTFATSDTSTNNISVSTTNGTGYTLGIKASTEGSNALNGANSTSIPSHTVSAGISEATYSTDSTYNNTWGYRPSKLNSTANSNYLPGPTSASTAITLDKTTSANPSTANNYNLAIGARVNDSTAPGAYSNVFVLTVTANPIPYAITYNKNTTDTVTNMPSNVSSQTYDETVNISGLVPARDGFNFKGWCTVQVADGGTCSGTTYNPDGGGTALTWTLDQTVSSNSLNLYAMWTAKTYSLAVTFVGTGVTSVKVCTVSGNCSGANLKGTISTSGGSVSGLSYGTAYYLYPAFSTGHKIASWAKTSTTGTLSSTTANNPTFTMGAGDGAVKITPTNSKCSDWSKCIQNTSVSCGTTMTDGRDGATYTTATINSKCWMTRNLRFTGADLIVGETNVTSKRTISPYGALTSGNSYTEARKQYNNNTNYGAYYNFCAASAQTVCNDTTKADATQDICPAGWKLPTQAQLNALPQKESHFTAKSGLAGWYDGGSLSNAGAHGGWWASTANSATRQYSLYYSSDYGYWGVSTYDKHRGFSVRCVRAS